jgi:hypothetical protein
VSGADVYNVEPRRQEPVGGVALYCEYIVVPSPWLAFQNPWTGVTPLLTRVIAPQVSTLSHAILAIDLTIDMVGLSAIVPKCSSTQ